MKTCIKCFVEKDISEFIKKENKCKACHKIYMKNRKLQKDLLQTHKTCKKCKTNKLKSEYAEKNAYCNECKIWSKQNRINVRNLYEQTNKEKIKKRNKSYKEKHKEKCKKIRLAYYLNNKEKLSLKDKNYRNLHKEKLDLKKKIYLQNPENKKRINEAANKLRKEKRKNNPTYKLMGMVGNSIRNILFTKNKKKHGKSCWNFLPYTKEQLISHLESLFEPWMNWSNHGQYLLNSWDDNDPTTWKWQIDHIIPHCSFNYSSMSDPEFAEAWALSNLRPLSAKENVIKGNSI